MIIPVAVLRIDYEGGQGKHRNKETVQKKATVIIWDKGDTER